MNKKLLCVSAKEDSGSFANPAMQSNGSVPSAPLDILNIKETVARAKAAGYNLSTYTLRRAIKSGAIPCRIVGGTYLISWRNLERWILCEDGCDNDANTSSDTCTIQPLSADIQRHAAG